MFRQALLSSLVVFLACSPEHDLRNGLGGEGEGGGGGPEVVGTLTPLDVDPYDASSANISIIAERGEVLRRYSCAAGPYENGATVRSEIQCADYRYELTVINDSTLLITDLVLAGVDQLASTFDAQMTGYLCPEGFSVAPNGSSTKLAIEFYYEGTATLDGGSAVHDFVVECGDGKRRRYRWDDRRLEPAVSWSSPSEAEVVGLFADGTMWTGSAFYF